MHAQERICHIVQSTLSPATSYKYLNTPRNLAEEALEVEASTPYDLVS